MNISISILGSTGSIGTQTLDIVRRYPERFRVAALTANRNWELLVQQAIEFNPERVVIADKSYYTQLCDALADTSIQVLAGEEAICEVVNSGDVIVNSLVGYSGLYPTLAAIRAGKKIALANKESLVVAGAIVMDLAKQQNVPIVPIDSEHSAIYQCLVGETSPARRLILTCSGGAFRTWSRDEMERATAAQALKHPKWNMGRKITIDSATLVNKGFEVIEAHWLFGMPASQIDVVVHPESIVHSMVEFADGAVKAQLGSPDMHVPIAYALTHPERVDLESPTDEPFDFVKQAPFHFEKVPAALIPAMDIAYDCLRRGGNAACTMNAANEVAVEAFLNGRCRFFDIIASIEHALATVPFIPTPSLDDLALTDSEARRVAREFLG